MDKNYDILQNSIDERIESFLRGTMSTEEEGVFKQEIKTNPDLRNRAMVMASLIRGLQSKNKAAEDAIIRENAAKAKVRPMLWWVCSVAAVFALFFSIYTDRRYQALNNMLSPYYMPYDMSEVSRGEEDSVTITRLYSLFNEIKESRSMTHAIAELEPIYASLDTDYDYHLYANDIAWNLALAYIKGHQKDNAIPILEKIKQDNPDTPLYNKADELIRQLSDL